MLGWRPYEGESEPGKRVIWTAFVTDDTLLSMSKSGTLILWSVPDGKAIYVAEGAGLGVVGLSPGRKVLVVYRDDALRFLDPSAQANHLGRVKRSAIRVRRALQAGRIPAATVSNSPSLWKAGCLCGST